MQLAKITQVYCFFSAVANSLSKDGYVIFLGREIERKKDKSTKSQTETERGTERDTQMQTHRQRN